MDEAVAARFAMHKELADEVIRRLGEALLKSGFKGSDVRLKQAQDACYRLEKDPSNAQYALVGDWFDDRGAKLGCLLFHADGSFFVEHDVIKPHPTKPRWFVEAVHAWGKDTQIKAEVRLLPMPE